MERRSGVANHVLGIDGASRGVFPDDRGFNMESYKQSEFADNGIPWRFVQDNRSHSTRQVLRGLHDIAERIAWALDVVRLEVPLDRPPEHLSGVHRADMSKPAPTRLDPLLEVRELSVDFATEFGDVRAVDSISFDGYSSLDKLPLREDVRVCHVEVNDLHSLPS